MSNKQPIIVTRELAKQTSTQLETQPDLMLKPIQFTKQQLGSRERALQLNLFSPTDKQATIVDISGANLLPHEAKVVEAVQIALHRTGYVGEGEEKRYRGHFEVVQRMTSDNYMPYGATIREAGIFISELEILEHGGWNRRGNGRFDTSQKQQVRDALHTLMTEMRSIAYKRWDGSVVRISAPLIRLEKVEDFENIAHLVGGGDPRTTWYKITPHHLWMDGLGTFHFLQEVTLIRQIDEAKAAIKGGQGRPTEHERLFVMWLLTLDTPYIEVKQETLAERLRLNYLLKSRHTGRIAEYIQDAIQVALKLDMLLNHTIIENEESEVKYAFEINPLKCSRLRRKLEKANPKQR